MPRAKKTDEPQIHTSEGTPGEVRVRVSFPTVMGRPTEDRAPIAHLEVTDAASSMTILTVDIPANEFVRMLSGGQATLPAWITQKPQRIGKRMQVTSTEVSGYGSSLDIEAEAARTAYLANGWEEVSIQRTNTGRRVVARRWID
jgi:hypothetical protein